MTATAGDAPSPTILVVGHDTDEATTLVQAGTLVGWADDRGVRLVPTTAERLGEVPDPGGVDAVVVLGALEGAWDDAVPWLAGEIALLREADRRGTPILGICFGGQLLARVLGGTVAADRHGEHGWTEVDTAEEELVGRGPWLEFHGDSFTAPPGAERVASTARCDQAFRVRGHLGVQFHPEVTVEVFDTWVARWTGTELEERLPGLGVDPAALRSTIAARAGASRTAARALFDAFWTRAGLADRMLVPTQEGRT